VVLCLFCLFGCGSDVAKSPQAPARPAVPDMDKTPAASAAVAIPAGNGALAVMAPGSGLTLRDKPHGRVIAHLNETTDWESPTVVWALQRRGRWLGVVATALKNNQIGWVDVQHDRPRMWRSEFKIRADLSERSLELLRGNRVIKRMTVGIGGMSSPTPVGRFTVTDKLIPSASAPYYGCCVLALSGHQPNLRPGWAGGDRIAIHGGGEIGAAASAGCLHAPDSQLKRLMKLVPVGTPVVIRA
jgi:hypothetical protein